MVRGLVLPLTGAVCRPVRRVGVPCRPVVKKLRRRVCYASEEPDEVEEGEDAEERIARLEAAARGGGGEEVVEKREVEKEQPEQQTWKEGELLPEGWEDLTMGQKLWELYAGERGGLFWANKVAFAAAIAVGVSWILFRFVGPNLGLYELKSTFTS